MSTVLVGKNLLMMYMMLMIYFDFFMSQQDLKFDLGDCSLWEYMFPTSDKPPLSIPDPDEDLDLDEEDEEEETEKHLDIPPSWCLPVAVSYKGMMIVYSYHEQNRFM